MATYRGRKTDICRKVGFNIWGQAKCPSTKRPYPLGQHGPAAKDKRGGSQYAEQLLAKQVIRRYYHMLEKQFSNLFKRAQRIPGDTGLNFLRLLDLRLQTAVWKLGYAKTIFQARQMITHGHITVNGNLVDIPSYQLKINDVIGVRDNAISRAMATRNHYEAAAVPAYFEPNVPEFTGKVICQPEFEDFPKFFQVQQVVEYYGR